MCGRFTIRSPAKDIAEAFELFDVPDLPPRYNVAPTQPVPAVRWNSREGKRELAFFRWGLIPHWADDLAIGSRMINARSESAATKPGFRRPFQNRRCLVVTDGFYEWKRTGKSKQPHLIRLKQDRPFAFAGLWDRWRRDGERIDSCTILTTDANELVSAVHDRMPVILPPDRYAAWLDPELRDSGELQAMLKPYPAEEMQLYPVSTVVNNPRNDVEACLSPVEQLWLPLGD